MYLEYKKYASGTDDDKSTNFHAFGLSLDQATDCIEPTLLGGGPREQ